MKPAPMPTRDVVGQRHEDHRQERREAVLDVGDVDVPHLREHQVADEHEGRRRRDARDDARERREEDREQEQDAGDDRREAGPGALGDAGGALDVGRVRRDAGEAADGRGDAVDEQDAARRPAREPSSRASPASAATPVTVPIVSKKSVSMIAKITRIAVSSGSVVKTLPMSNAPEGREARRPATRFAGMRRDAGDERDDRRDEDRDDQRRLDPAGPQDDRSAPGRTGRRTGAGVVGSDTVTSVPMHAVGGFGPGRAAGLDQPAVGRSR